MQCVTFSDVIIKDKVFCFIGVYGFYATSELPEFFWHIKPFVMLLRLVVLVGEWNTVFDPKIVSGRDKWVINDLDAKYFEFDSRLDLVNKASKSILPYWSAF